MKTAFSLMCLFLCFSLLFCGCSSNEQAGGVSSVTPSVPSVTLADTNEMELEVTEPLVSSTVSNPTVVELSPAVSSAPSSSPSSAVSTPNPSSASSSSITLPSEQPLTITAGGNYLLSGEKKDAMITVDVGEDTVTLTLAGVTVQNQKGPALYIASAKKVTIVLQEGTQNLLSDGTSYTYTHGATPVDAALFSRADLTIGGKGSLTVQGNYKHAIVGKDDLVFNGGSYTVTAKNVAIDGKDCVKTKDASFTLNAGTDGIRSSNAENANKGFISLTGGSFSITAGNDALQAATLLHANNLTLNATCGGGFQNTDLLEGSFKGIKAGSDIQIHEGTYTLNTKDDALHADGSLLIDEGTFTLASGNDALKAANDLSLQNGTLTVTACADGLQAANLVITGGNTTITPSQSGVQVTGNFYQSAGTLTIYGTHGSGKAVVNFGGTATVEGGTLLAFGDSAKARHLTKVTNQCALLLPLSAQQPNTPFTLTKNGKTLAAATPPKGYSFILVSAPGCDLGSYTLQVGSVSDTVTVNQQLFTMK